MMCCGIHFDMTHSGGQRSVVAIVSIIIGYLEAILESHAD